LENNKSRQTYTVIAKINTLIDFNINHEALDNILRLPNIFEMSSTVLESYDQVLSPRLAAHLLRRATYNYNISRIKQFSTLTASQAVDLLFDFENQPLHFPNGPLSWKTPALPKIFDLLDSSSVAINNLNERGRAAVLWKTLEGLYDDSARWKVLHWLHTLFPVRVSEFFYFYWRLLDKCLGTDQNPVSLKTIALKITTDKNMMEYLNNEINEVGAPNENFAREVLELMTIRKGPSISLGNYTYYTEADIQNAAKVLTGFTLDNADTYIPNQSSYFQDSLFTEIVTSLPVVAKHDFSAKTFSAELSGGAPTIFPATPAADQDTESMYKELKDFYLLVFNNEETSKSFVRRMYQYFVRDVIDSDTEQNVILPLAAELKNSDYDYIQTIKTLLTSEHFYDVDDTDSTNEIIGGKIKSPWEMILQTINLAEIQALPISNQQETKLSFQTMFKVFAEEHFRSIGLNLRGPDTVEGYPGFYDEPNFSKNWFSSNSLFKRLTVGESLKGNFEFSDDGSQFEIPFPFIINDFIGFFNQFEILDNSGAIVSGTKDDPMGVANADYLVTQMLTYFLPEIPDENRFEYFLNSLLGGLSSINWYFSWVEYLSLTNSTPANIVNDVTNNVRVGLERLFDAILSSPEFQTF